MKDLLGYRLDTPRRAIGPRWLGRAAISQAGDPAEVLRPPTYQGEISRDSRDYNETSVRGRMGRIHPVLRILIDRSPSIVALGDIPGRFRRSLTADPG